MAESEESDGATSDVATKVERDFYNSRDLSSEFLVDDEGAFTDDNDPDWAEEYASKGKGTSLNADASSDSSLESGEESRHKFKRKRKSAELKTGVRVVSKVNAALGDSSRGTGVPTSVQKHKRRQQKTTAQLAKKGDRPRISKIADENGDDESDDNDDGDIARKFLSVLIEEDEKSDTDEIAILLSIQESLKVVAQKQETVMDLLTDFVKKRHSQ